MHNENRSRQTQSTATSVQNLNVQDTEGVTLADADGNTINVLDGGAIAGALGFGEQAIADALDFSTDTVSRVLGFGGDALDFGSDAIAEAIDAVTGSQRNALDFGGQALDRIADAADSDRGFLADVFDKSGSFASDIFGQALESVEGVLREGQAQLGNTVTTLNQIARQQSTSEAERIQDIAGQALKIGAIMVGLIAAAFIFSRARG